MATTVLRPTYAISGWAANVDDDFGIRWVATSQDATDGPAPKLRTSERPYAAGAYRATSFPASNPITLQGWGRGPGGRAAVVAARQRFLGLFTDGGQQLLVIDDGLAPKQALVELAAKPKFTIWPDCSGFDWQLPLLATDPVFYDTNLQLASTSLPTPSGVGLDWVTGGGLNWVSGGGLNWGLVTSSGTMTLTNTGNAISWPVFTLAGPLTLPIVTDNATGQKLAYSGTLVGGDSLVITTNPAGRSVLLNGSDRFTLMTSASWFPVPPASTVTVALAASAGSGSLSASWRNASW
jgi:hypothetical protein